MHTELDNGFSLYLFTSMKNIDVSCCSSQSLPKPDTYPKPVNVPSPLHKSSLFVRSFSPSISPLSVEKSLLKQIESPLVCGWVWL